MWKELCLQLSVSFLNLLQCLRVVARELLVGGQIVVRNRSGLGHRLDRRIRSGPVGRRVRGRLVNSGTGAAGLSVRVMT